MVRKDFSRRGRELLYHRENVVPPKVRVCEVVLGPGPVVEVVRD